MKYPYLKKINNKRKMGINRRYLAWNNGLYMLVCTRVPAVTCTNIAIPSSDCSPFTGLCHYLQVFGHPEKWRHYYQLHLMSPEISPMSCSECPFPERRLCFERLWSLKGEGSSWRMEVPGETFQAFQPPTSSFQGI